MNRLWLLTIGAVFALPGAASAQRAALARETAEVMFQRFGAKAGRSVPELAGRIENIAARYGDDAVHALRKGGPQAVGLVEAAGADGQKALRVLAVVWQWPAAAGAWHMIHSALGFLMTQEIRGDGKDSIHVGAFADATLGGLLKVP